MEYKVFENILDEYNSAGRLRHLPQALLAEGVTDFSSNDYLGLAERSDLTVEFLRQIKEPRFTSAASRLLALHQESYAALEAQLENDYGKPALLFNSGYHLNTGCVSAIGALPGTVIVSDKLVHASIIDGIRLSKAPFRRFRHNDVKSLRAELAKAAEEGERILLVVESIYSMDGDIAPLKDFVALKEEYPNLMLYVDEAHAVGVRGRFGLGVCEELDIIDKVDVIAGTFGKACSSVGAFAAVNQTLKVFLLNSSRSFIFSTALPPVNVQFTRFILSHIKAMNKERAHLAQISQRFRYGLETITHQKSVSSSQIVPLMAWSNEKALKISAKLREAGIIALPIRKPTVPAGTERIRFSLNASMDERDIDDVLNKIEHVL